MNLDWNLFLALNHLAGQSPLVDALARFFDEDAYLSFGVLLVALWFLPAPTQVRRARQRQSINAVIALAGALLAAHFIGVFFYRARPFVVAPALARIESPILEQLARWRLA